MLHFPVSLRLSGRVYFRILTVLALIALLTPLIVIDGSRVAGAKAAAPQTVALPNNAPPQPFAIGLAESPVLSVNLAATLATWVGTVFGIDKTSKPAAPESRFELKSTFGKIESRNAAVEPVAAPPQPAAAVDFDFDGDGKADISRWHPQTAEFKIHNSNGGSYSTYTVGSSGAKIAPADYDGDGKTDAATFNAGTWTIRKSTNGNTETIAGFGQSGDIPVSGNYTGTSADELAYYRPSNGTWYWREVSNPTVYTYGYGVSTDIPVPGDYDGNGYMEPAIYRASDGYWWISSNGAIQWGVSIDIPVMADYDADGKTDPAVFRPSTGQWWVLRSSTGYSTYEGGVWGNVGDQPVVGDFDGDSKADWAVWRPTTGKWTIRTSGNNSSYGESLGANGDTMVPSSYIKQVGSQITPDIINQARLSPKNGTGGTNLYSQNFSWGTSLVGLSGRSGHDLGIGISYNSLIWTKVGNTMLFNTDADQAVAPGFRIGFPTIEPAYYNDETDKFNYLMLTPGGSRVEFRQQGAGSTYETYDSSYTQLVTAGASTPNDPVENINITVTTTDGTQMAYDWIAGAFRCTQIKDRNGNVISIAYDPYDNGLIDYVTDTLGRVVTFNYDQNAILTSISQTWKDNNGQGSNTTHTYATFSYTTKTLDFDFDPSLFVFGTYYAVPERVLDKITYTDGSFTKFLYNGYAQVYKIENHAADSTTGTPHILNYIRTNLESPSADQTDCPRFTQTRDYVENFNAGSETTTMITRTANQPYSVSGTSGTGTKIEVAMQNHPHNAVSKMWVAESGWGEGLTLATEDWADGTSGFGLQRWTSMAYEQDQIGLTPLTYRLNPRVIETKVGDGTNTKRTTISYLRPAQQPQNTDVSLYGLPVVVTVYDADQTTVLKQSNTLYNLDSAYTSRRIIGLPSDVEVQGYNQLTSSLELVSKVTYAYDEGDFSDSSLQQNISPVQHDNTKYGSSFSYRGNVTSTTRWDATQPTNGAAAITSSMKYNTAGSVVAHITPWDDTNTRTVKIAYEDSVMYNDGVTNRTTYAYPTKIYDPAGNYSQVKYRFDFGANVRAESPAPAGNAQGKITEREFDSLGRLSKEKIVNNGTYTRYEYPANGTQSKVFSTIIDTDNDGADADDEVLAESWTDGAGRTRMSRTPHTFNGGATATWAGTLTEYDILGRVKRQSVPTEVDANFDPTGDDLTRGWLWTQAEYDWMGRTTRTINTDGTDTLKSYEGCGCAGGLITTVEGENIVETDWQGNNPVMLGRRKQRMYSDVLGRTWKAETLNWNGSVYSTTQSQFNGRDQAVTVTLTEQSTSISQVTSATYDGHGRLKTQHRPEQDAGTSTNYDYYPDDSIRIVTDARGATTTNVYNSRGLLESISYGAPANSGIYVPPAVTVSFDDLGNRTQMTDETGTVSYQYDQLSRLVSETKLFSGLSNSFSLTYQYGLSSQLKSLTNADGTAVAYVFDKTGRLTSVNGQGFEHKNVIWSGSTPTYTTYYINQIAGSIQYRAWGAIKHAEFQDGRQYDITYNSRLKPYEYTMPDKLAKRYSYYADGTLSYARDLIDNRNDRSFSYDNMGRAIKVYGGYVARGEQPNLSSPNWYDLYVPVKNDYVYNAFSNPTSRKEANSRMFRTDIQYQSLDADMLMNYTNNRGQSARPNSPTWVYDEDGRLVEEVDTYGTSITKVEYGANGQARKTTVTGSDVLDRKTSHSDAEGKPVKEAMYTSVQYYDENGTPLPPVEETSNRYYLTSTALGGSVMSLIYETGNVGQTNIYADGRKIASYSPNTGSYSKFIWEHSDPNGISGYGSSYDTRDYWSGSPTDDLTLPGKKEYEPNGLEVARLPNQSDLVTVSGGGDTGWTPGEVGGGWENFDCVWDGVNVPCGWVDHYTNSGDDSPVVQAPADNVAAIWSNSQRRFVGLAVWDVTAAQNGLAFLGRDSLGWLPTNVSYTPGSGLTGENVYQWFGGFPGSRLGSSEANPNFISEKSVKLYSMMQGMEIGGNRSGGERQSQIAVKPGQKRYVKRDDANKMMVDAYNRALDLMKNNRNCRDAISTGHLDAVEQAERISKEGNFVPYENVIQQTPGGGTTIADSGKVQINAISKTAQLQYDGGDVRFFNSFFQDDLNTRYSVGRFEPKDLGMTSDDARVLNILHELAHVTGKYAHPGASLLVRMTYNNEVEMDSATMNALIWHACFGQNR